MITDYHFSVPEICVLAVVVSAASGWLIVATKRWHGRLTLDHTDGCQKFHEAPTPRVGGVALLCGIASILVFSDSAQALLASLVIAGIPAFLAGLGEDLTRSVGVTIRLGATVLSGLIACLLTNTWLRSVGVPVADLFFSFPLVAIPVTAVAIAGVANALNIIDGFNGLAGGSAIIVLVAIALIALGAADTQLAEVAFLLAGVVAGFLAVNFPGGRLFLGDGGAYFLGFLLAWMAVLLVERNVGTVSPWAGFMACAYPVLEMFFSMWRKTRREGHHMSRPDGLHLHMLIHRRVVGRAFPELPATMKNAATAPFCWALAAAPAAIAVLASDTTAALMIGALASAAGYVAVYTRLTRFRWGLGSVLFSGTNQATG